MPKYREGTEDPETQDCRLHELQRCDVTTPPLQSRKQQKDLETQTELTTLESRWPLQTNLYIFTRLQTEEQQCPQRPELPHFPCEDTRASAHTPGLLSRYHFKLFP